MHWLVGQNIHSSKVYYQNETLQFYFLIQFCNCWIVKESRCCICSFSLRMNKTTVHSKRKEGTFYIWWNSYSFFMHVSKWLLVCYCGINLYVVKFKIICTKSVMLITIYHPCCYLLSYHAHLWMIKTSMSK